MKSPWTSKKYVYHYNKHYLFTKEDRKFYCSLLELTPSDILVDFGCGNGDFLLAALPYVKKVIGIDVSIHQLFHIKRKSNLEIIESSFLDCDLAGYQFSKGFSRAALHHLKDNEKALFFKKISRHFSRGGLFVLEDMIFNFKKTSFFDNREALIKEAIPYYGKAWETKKYDIFTTLLVEYPTDIFTWKKIFTQSGFELINIIEKTSFISTIVARKR